MHILIYTIRYQQVDLLAMRVFLFFRTYGCLSAWMMEYAIRFPKHGTSS